MGGRTDDRNGPEVASGDRLTLLWRRIKEHRLAQWTVGYVAVAYGIQHAVTLTSEAFKWPDAVIRISMLLLALGLPVAMTLAWYHGERASRRISAHAAGGGYLRNLFLANAYAAAGRYSDAADTLLLITANFVSRRSLEDAARIIRSAPTKTKAPEALPALGEGLSFVYDYVGAPDRVMEAPERDLEIRRVTQYGLPLLWSPEYAPSRKTERFKALMRNTGLVDYWRARGWPDLCHRTTGNDFACE